LDRWWKFRNDKKKFSRLWNSNSWFSFWRNNNSISNNTEEYDGSAWTAGGNLGTTRDGIGGLVQTAGLAFAGSPTSTATEEYDGSAWTAGGNLNTARASPFRGRNTNARFRIWWLYNWR
jgi:hypothetical protein